MSGTREDALAGLFAAWAMLKNVEIDGAPLPTRLVGTAYHGRGHPFCELARALSETIEETVGIEVLAALEEKRLTREQVEAAERQAIEVGEAGAAELARAGYTLDERGNLVPPP